MGISHAEQPLKPDELCHALAVQIRSPDLNSDNVPPIGTLLSCCQGLVVVDKEASNCPDNPLYPSRVPPCSSRTFWRRSLDNCRNLLKLPGFAADQGSPNQLSRLPRFPNRTFSQIFFSILGSAREKGPFRLRETACAEVI